MYWRRKWPWIGQQNWEDIIFLHWPINVNDLRPYIPEPLTIDKYHNNTWLTIIFFKAKQSRLRSFSPALAYKPFYQLNVRTYVRFGEEPGVYFFTLDANSPLIVKGGKLLSLPYVEAKMDLVITNNERIFTSSRIDGDRPASFIAQYSPDHKPYIPHSNSLAHWLTERYCIWMVNGKKIMKAPISHLPWVLHDVKVDMKMSGLSPIPLANQPLTHYAKSMTTYAHPFEQFGIYN